MEVEVRYYTVLREITEKRYERVKIQPNSSIKDLINILVEKYGYRFSSYIYDNNQDIRKHVSYMLNGVNIKKNNGFATVLQDNDIFSFLPLVGGG